jgi:hypothetical protein
VKGRLARLQADWKETKMGSFLEGETPPGHTFFLSGEADMVWLRAPSKLCAYTMSFQDYRCLFFYLS